MKATPIKWINLIATIISCVVALSFSLQNNAIRYFCVQHFGQKLIDKIDNICFLSKKLSLVQPAIIEYDFIILNSTLDRAVVEMFQIEYNPAKLVKVPAASVELRAQVALECEKNIISLSMSLLEQTNQYAAFAIIPSIREQVIWRHKFLDIF